MRVFACLFVATYLHTFQEFAFSIPEFYVLLRIQEWHVFLASTILTFIVELLAVTLILWLHKDKKLVHRVKTKLRQTMAANLILGKEKATAAVDDDVDSSSSLQTMLLATKIAHEELCEKASVVR